MKLNDLHSFDLPEVLWISTSPNLQRFDRSLLQVLSRPARVRCWTYCQTPDEPCSLEAAVAMLREYLQARDRPVHLLGHGIGGIVALLYARQYPVRSLVLLSVSASPAMNWHSQYYALRNLLPCCRDRLLAHFGSMLFDNRGPAFATALAGALARDLDNSLTLHSLAGYETIPAGGVESPLMACRGALDPIIDAEECLDWEPWLKPSDRFWSCPQGKHFFHHDYPETVGRAITEFWQTLSTKPLVALPADEVARATERNGRDLNGRRECI